MTTTRTIHRWTKANPKKDKPSRLEAIPAGHTVNWVRPGHVYEQLGWVS